MLKGIYLMGEHVREVIYSPREQADIAALVDMIPEAHTPKTIKNNPEVLKDVDVIFSGWGAPHMDKAFLDLAPKLKVVFYGAGSIKAMVSDAFWERNILVTSAYAANAIPVSEYTLSQILFSLKRGWYFALKMKREKKYCEREFVPAVYGSTVGIISLGMIGRRVCELLKSFDVKVIAYDPFVSSEQGAELGVEMCSLEDIFRRADVVSLHTPWLKETENMITGEHIRSMKKYATFINTARGAIVKEKEMLEVLAERQDLTAVLDVTYPEPPEAGSPIFTLSNVILTPHIAGSMDAECYRMGRYMVEELERYIKGEPLKWGIDRKKAAILA